MNKPAKPLDLFTANNNSYRSKRIEERLRKELSDFDLDVDKEKRLKDHVCRSCFYLLHNVGLCAMYTQPCGICGEDMIYGSSDTDIVCRKCAVEHHLCRHCGGDLDMKQRRNWK